METHSLENSIRTLKKVRDVYSSQFDTSVLTELNAVIQDLEESQNRMNSREKLKTLSFRGLQMIATVIRVLRLIGDVQDLMK